MRAVLWVFSIVILIYLAAVSFKQDITNWLFPNIVRVNFQGEALPQLTNIKWTSEAENDTIVIYDNGKQLTQSFRARGFNTFLLYYDNKLVDSFEQFKNNPNSPHYYEFLLYKQRDSLLVDLKIKGAEAAQ
ncbi:hypothetical protein E1176_16965 [Fulvivirga sp. RKSG066]|uniref:hypothetical protein n=1 Tax=Fulvivirga aurantia TaxID=2529383 RepID=UPI0012BC726F|nr:hypothetical protein [Fulvivirga aurantia]MTI22726.1 hypothetical protein [Fulvivirga aurantia]